jgi:hypothetical protein
LQKQEFLIYFLEVKMVKGVNKRVLEINNPDSLYFEKAVFFLRPNMKNVPEKLMKREAQNVIMSISPAASRQNTLFKIALTSVVVLSAAVGVVYFIASFFI